ncbi:MAG TPA: phage terminase large subunit family protein [Verrucomicrobiae bacterium]|nr:phage terminase large subunit family protein [Verrucomicrobiae bacterium]
MQIPAHRLPLRDYQQEIVTALDSPDLRQAVLVVARRGAKTYTVFVEHIIPAMVKETMNVVIVYPTAKQGFKNFWTNIENDGFKTLDHIPKELVQSQSNTEDDMRITLINGSTLFVLGATNAEALRGANAKIYFFDEFVDLPSGVLGVVRPITNRNGGKIIIASTPKQDGISGGTFKKLHEAAKTRRKQYTCFIPGDRFMTPEEMEELRQDYIDEYGNDFLYRQEILLDWGQSSTASYYGEIMGKKDKDGTIGLHPYNPAYPVFTAWDLGKSDSMVLGFFQYFKGVPRLIDLIEINGSNIEAMADELKAKSEALGYNYGWHFLPHDGTVSSLNDGKSRIETLHKKGITNVSTLKRESVSIGIGYAESWLPKLLINLPTTGDLSRKLRIYRKKFNPHTGDYIGPDHKSQSHIADMIRYLATALHHFFNEKGEFILSSSVAQETYESDLATVSFSSV